MMLGLVLLVEQRDTSECRCETEASGGLGLVDAKQRHCIDVYVQCDDVQRKALPWHQRLHIQA